jgi:hypothetical protein
MQKLVLEENENSRQTNVALCCHVFSVQCTPHYGNASLNSSVNYEADLLQSRDESGLLDGILSGRQRCSASWNTATLFTGCHAYTVQDCPLARRFTFKLQNGTWLSYSWSWTFQCRFCQNCFVEIINWNVNKQVQQSFVRNNVLAFFNKHVYHNKFRLKSKPSSDVIVYRILNLSYH